MTNLYLWDANILRHFGEGHPTLRAYLERTPWATIALPSVVVAEVLRGRCEFALKASPNQAPKAHARLIETSAMLQSFSVVVFDDLCLDAMLEIQRRVNTRKRHADAMIAATAIASSRILVTRNVKHFSDLLPNGQIANWIDVAPA